MTWMLYVALLVITVACAMWRGGPPERWGAGIIATGSIVTAIIAASRYSTGFRGFEWGIFAVDALTLVAMVVLALRAERIWPLWMAALQLVAVCCHAARLSDPQGVIPWAYAIILAVWSYPMLILVLFGTRRHQQRLRKYGTDRSWSRSLNPARSMPLHPPKS